MGFLKKDSSMPFTLFILNNISDYLTPQCDFGYVDVYCLSFLNRPLKYS